MSGNTVPVWLFTGPEIGERNAAIDRLRADCAKRSGNLDSHILYASDVRVGEALSLLQNGSLFADARFVVIRGAEGITRKDEVTQLADWIESAGGVEGAYLVLVSDEIGVDRRIEAAVPKENKRVFWELFEDRKERWIADFFRREGMEIEPEAVAAILDLVENNTEALRAACQPFALVHGKGYRLTEADVERVLSHNREESAFTLFDALAKGDLESALAINGKLSLSKDSSPVQTIAGLTYCFRRLADWHRLAAASAAGSGSMDEFSLKKAGFTSKRAVEQYRLASRRWDAPTTARALALLSSTDLELRSAGLQETRLELCLYSLLRANARRVAAMDAE